LPLLLVDDGEDSGNRLSDGVAGGQHRVQAHARPSNRPPNSSNVCAFQAIACPRVPRSIPHDQPSSSPFISPIAMPAKRKLHAHLGQLAGGSTGDLLDSQRSELSLKLVEEREQVLLVPACQRHVRVSFLCDPIILLVHVRPPVLANIGPTPVPRHPLQFSPLLARSICLQSSLHISIPRCPALSPIRQRKIDDVTPTWTGARKRGSCSTTRTFLVC